MTTHLLAVSAPQSQPFLVLVMPYLIIAVVFYLLLIRPAQVKRKELERLVNELKKGDKVVTGGGFYGEVVKTDETTVVLKLAENVKVKVAKRAIAGLEGSTEDKGGE